MSRRKLRTDNDDPEPGHCPFCGRYCKGVHATFDGLENLKRVNGICSQHGVVDLTKQAWNYDDFGG